MDGTESCLLMVQVLVKLQFLGDFFLILVCYLLFVQFFLLNRNFVMISFNSYVHKLHLDVIVPAQLNTLIRNVN